MRMERSLSLRPATVAALGLLLTAALPGARSLEAQTSPPLATLVDRCIEAYGGAEALAAVAGWQQLGKLVTPGGGEAVVARVFAPPHRLRVENRFSQDRREVRILNGENAWRNGVPVEGPLRQAMVLQAARLSLPGILLEGRDRLVDLGEVDREGASFRLLELALRDGMRLQVEIDPASGRIHRSRSLAGPVVFETVYSDFREVDGVLFAFAEETWAMGHLTGRTELEAVVLSDGLRDLLFYPGPGTP